MADSCALTELEQCRRCPRLVRYLAELPPKGGRSRSEYWNAPVPAFGSPSARVWLLGLAPGAHGANRTGRPFTGDGAGDFMYPLLHRAGFCSQAEAVDAADGMVLQDLYISNAVRCVPPQNKPTASEFAACRPFLAQEWQQLSRLKVVLALGRDAFISFLHFLKGQGLIERLADYPFAHGVRYPLPGGRWLVGCYHTSRYNVQTGRITAELFLEVLRQVDALRNEEAAP
ncbi:MAG: uracil-DNA glycosylase [Desulfuromonadaceae bacterium]|nr:uracil-DNA glycosylase [Desulfuromonadaceae bacterium]